MNTDQRGFPMANGTLIHPKEQNPDLRDAFGTGAPMRGENCGIKSQMPYQATTFFPSPMILKRSHSHKSDRSASDNGICENGTSPAKNGIDTAGKKNLSALLHGAFSTPLASSPSKFIKRPSPSTAANLEPTIGNRGPNDFDEGNSLSPSVFASPPLRKMFMRRPRNSSSAFFGSPSTSNEAFNSSTDFDDPFSFKAVPVLFMFDCSPIAPFFTNAYCFSNHFRCACLIIDGERYICSEQYYMFYKARVFGDKRAMRQIMATEDPKLMKKIGANVEGFDQEKWYKIAIQVMVIANVKKYEQNPELRRQLFETSGADLIEVNPTDQRWSIGLAMSDWRIREKKWWKGLNWLGRLLTMLRDKLLERPEFAAEKQQLLSEISASFEAANSVGCLRRIGAQKEGDEAHSVPPAGEEAVSPTGNSFSTRPSP